MESYCHSKISGIGAFLPEQRVTTDELLREVNCRRFGIPENYISKFIGIKEKRVADPKMEPSELAALASEIALRDAGVSANEIDLIIYTGVAKDFIEPSTAHNVQFQLGATNAVCLDASNACAGFMTGVSIGDAYIAGKAANKVLVCTGEHHRSLIEDTINELKTSQDKAIFKSKLGLLTVGDAGAAMILESRSEPSDGLKWMEFLSAGQHHQLCFLKWKPSGIEGEMIMQTISQETLKFHWQLIDKTYDKLEWFSSDVDILYSHQVGRRPYQEMLELSSVPTEKAPITFEKYGNMASATIPVSMSLNPPKKGDKVLFLGAGSGITVCQGGMVF